MVAIDMSRGVSNAFNDAIVFLPKLIAFIVIVFLGWLIGKLTSKALAVLLRRAGVDAWAGRSALRRFWTSVPFVASELLAAIVRWAIIVLAIQLGLGIFGPNAVSTAVGAILGYIPRIFLAAVILIGAMGLARWLQDSVSAALSEVDGGRGIAVGTGLAVVIVGVFAALEELKVAPMIFVGLFYALLAIFAGAAIIAFGVGGIPVARRWLERGSVNAERTGRDLRNVRIPDDGERTETIPAPVGARTGDEVPSEPARPDIGTTQERVSP
jgi:Conserved TM helix